MKQHNALSRIKDWGIKDKSIENNQTKAQRGKKKKKTQLSKHKRRLESSVKVSHEYRIPRRRGGNGAEALCEHERAGVLCGGPVKCSVCVHKGKPTNHVKMFYILTGRAAYY